MCDLGVAEARPIVTPRVARRPASQRHLGAGILGQHLPHFVRVAPDSDGADGQASDADGARLSCGDLSADLIMNSCSISGSTGSTILKPQKALYLGTGRLDPSAWFEPLYEGRPVHPMMAD